MCSSACLRVRCPIGPTRRGRPPYRQQRRLIRCANCVPHRDHLGVPGLLGIAEEGGDERFILIPFSRQVDQVGKAGVMDAESIRRVQKRVGLALHM